MMTPNQNAWNIQRTPTSITWGFVVIAVFIVFFSIWAAKAPIDSAAIAHGFVSLRAHNKVIQHLEGGIIDTIFVRDGDLVQEGSPLIQLNDTSTQANLNLLQNQLYAALAQQARLIAERDDQSYVSYLDAELNRTSDLNIQKMIATENNLFSSRRNYRTTNIHITENRITQITQEIRGINAQMTAAHQRLELLKKEEKLISHLLEHKQETLPRLLALSREIAQTDGSIAESHARIAELEQKSGEATLQIMSIKNDFLNQVADELQKTQININDLRKKILATEDVLHRLLITAPQSGIVTALKYHTSGGVITPGTEILSIVPQNDLLLIETHLSPTDIDLVHPGLEAKVKLSAYKSRTSPTFIGAVTQVSPDRFITPTTGEPYYLVHVTISEKELLAHPEIKLYPGMPAEVYIVTGSRTFFTYLSDPIRKSLRRSFKED